MIWEIKNSLTCQSPMVVPVQMSFNNNVLISSMDGAVRRNEESCLRKRKSVDRQQVAVFQRS